LGQPLDWVGWRALKDEVADAALVRLTELAPQFADAGVAGARGGSLPFYRNHVLIELTFAADGFPERVFALHGADDTRWLDGNSLAIHVTNEAESLALTDETVHDYLRLFFYFVRNDHGDPFVLIESPDDIGPEDADPATDAPNGLEERLAAARSAVRALGEHTKHVGGNWELDVAVAYKGGLFLSSLLVKPDGYVEMTNDEPAANLEGLVIPEYEPLELELGMEDPAASTSDREVTEAIVAVLLEDAIGARDRDSAERSSLLRHFNTETGGGPIDRFARVVAGSVPVVIIESEIPFVEEFVAGLIEERDEVPEFPTPHRLSFYNGRGVEEDAERMAHNFAIEDRAALLGCDRRSDIPEPLRRIADLVLTFPSLDRGRFARIFERVFGAEPMPGWDDSETDWTRYLVPADFHQPRRLGLGPNDALPFMQERVEARLRQVTPDIGPGLHELHGMGEALQVCEDVLTDVQAALAGRIPWTSVDRGLLLVGAPGTGKTTLARALARECGIKFIVGSAASWQASGNLDAHLAAMRADFTEARRYAPSILFIDELDSIGSRESFTGQNAMYSTAVVDGLLEQIQGIDTADPVIVIGATNYADKIDPALRRAGRLDQVVAIPLPNIAALGEIFEYYLAPYRSRDEVERDVESKTLAQLCLGLTGADVEFFVRGASRRARRADRKITQDDLLAEVTRRPRRAESAPRLGREELRRVAVHEAGHAVARLTSSTRGDDLTFVSVVPRLDGSLGFVASVPSGANVATHRSVLEQLEAVLAGRAAEEVVFGAGNVGTGAGGSSRRSDLAVATEIAELLVCQSGFGGDGALRWTDKPTPSQDDQIAAVLADSYASIVARLERERPLLDRVADSLVDKQELSGSELRRLLGE
jgi:DNA polymerase III delta prime subunit